MQVAHPSGSADIAAGMSSGLVLILAVVGGYFAAHAAVEWLARRYQIVSGAEYLLLGVLLGPQVSGLIRSTVVESFAPFLTLAIGWAGALTGLQCHLPTLIRTRGVYYRVAFAEALTTMAFAAAVLVPLFAFVFDISFAETLGPGLTLAAIAAGSSSLGIAIVKRELPRRSSILRQLEIATMVDSFVLIVAFSLILCITHPAPGNLLRAPTATEWVAISIAIGVVGGALFHLFLAGEKTRDRLFIGLAGAVVLVSGASSYLRLSPLLPCFLVGAILVNTTRDREPIVSAVTSVARPFYFVLLIFAGAAWRPSVREFWWIVVIAFLIVRVIGKIGAARLAARANDRMRVLGPDWGRALLGQGALAVAVAVNYLLHDVSLLPNLVFTAAILSVLLTDLSSARFARSVVEEYVIRIRARASARTQPAAPRTG